MLSSDRKALMSIKNKSLLRALPLYGIFQLPQLLPAILPEYSALGANSIVIVISEYDRETSAHAIETVLRYCVLHGYRVYVSYENKYVDASRNKLITEYTWMLNIAQRNGCEGIYIDCNNGHIDNFLIIKQIAETCHSSGLRLFASMGISSNSDKSLLKVMNRLNLVDMLSITHKYEIASSMPLPLDHAIRAIEIVRSHVNEDQHLVMAIPANIVRSHATFLLEIVNSWRAVGIADFFVWGGFCANQAYFLNDHTLIDHGFGYSQIGKIFGRQYLYTKFAAEFNSLTR